MTILLVTDATSPLTPTAYGRSIYFSVYNAPTSYKNTLTFLYDADGTLSGFIDFNGKYNYYGRNAQGDITEIYSEDSVLLCKYVYDSWGKLVSVKDASGVDKTADASFIGNVNPFRYRGYYYDRETGLYYLNSRYYDPETGRFINADVLIDSGHELLGHNLFAYCNNNPVVDDDPSGYGVYIEFRVHRSPPTFGIPISRSESIDYSQPDYNQQWSQAVSNFNENIEAIREGAEQIWNDVKDSFLEARKRSSKNSGKDKVETDDNRDEHVSNRTPSNRNSHERGQTRYERDKGGEKGDARRSPNPNKRIRR